MDQIMGFFNKKLFQIDGLTFTVGVVLIIVILFFALKKS